MLAGQLSSRASFVYELPTDRKDSNPPQVSLSAHSSVSSSARYMEILPDSFQSGPQAGLAGGELFALNRGVVRLNPIYADENQSADATLEELEFELFA
eukprot:m.304748 g.304748  ORF g.304748 m.304748 type:complete len:98 (+) comp55274_c0_seq3:3127-3420(+)